jgi:hypothetical protein
VTLADATVAGAAAEAIAGTLDVLLGDAVLAAAGIKRQGGTHFPGGVGTILPFPDRKRRATGKAAVVLEDCTLIARGTDALDPDAPEQVAHFNAWIMLGEPELAVEEHNEIVRRWRAAGGQGGEFFGFEYREEAAD